MIFDTLAITLISAFLFGISTFYDLRPRYGVLLDSAQVTMYLFAIAHELGYFDFERYPGTNDGFFLFVCVIAIIASATNVRSGRKFVVAFVAVIVTAQITGYVATQDTIFLRLYLSDTLTDGGFYTREAADLMCYNPSCIRSVAVINFIQDGIKDMPSNYGFSAKSPVWFKETFVAPTWRKFMYSNNLPFHEVFWSGWDMNCDEWTGAGTGAVGMNALYEKDDDCRVFRTVLCLCVTNDLYLIP